MLAVDSTIYLAMCSGCVFLSPLLSVLPSGFGREIDFTALSFSPWLPGKKKWRWNVAFFCGLITEHGSLALNRIITGATN